MSLNKTLAEPLYAQIERDIKLQIDERRLAPGDYLQTELDLCREYDVSRITVRKALQSLVEAGYLVRVRGKGTQVAERSSTPRFTGVALTAFIANRFDAEFNASILGAYCDAMSEHGAFASVHSSNEDPESEMKAIERFYAAGVRSMVIMPVETSRLAVTALPSDLHVCLIDRDPGVKDADYVGSDNVGGTYVAVRHVASIGFRNVVFVAYETNLSSVMERWKGYQDAVKAFDLNHSGHIHLPEPTGGRDDWSVRIALSEMRERLAELKSITPVALVAVNDIIAAECVKIVQEEGLEVGVDVAIVGFDNLHGSQFVGPGLTTVAQNPRLLGARAAECSIRSISGQPRIQQHTTVPTHLVIRSSCGEYRRQ